MTIIVTTFAGKKGKNSSYFEGDEKKGTTDEGKSHQQESYVIETEKKEEDSFSDDTQKSHWEGKTEREKQRIQ